MWKLSSPVLKPLHFHKFFLLINTTWRARLEFDTLKISLVQTFHDIPKWTQNSKLYLRRSSYLARHKISSTVVRNRLNLRKRPTLYTTKHWLWSNLFMKPKEMLRKWNRHFGFEIQVNCDCGSFDAGSMGGREGWIFTTLFLCERLLLCSCAKQQGDWRQLPCGNFLRVQ